MSQKITLHKTKTSNKSEKKILTLSNKRPQQIVPNSQKISCLKKISRNYIHRSLHVHFLRTAPVYDVVKLFSPALFSDTFCFYSAQHLMVLKCKSLAVYFSILFSCWEFNKVWECIHGVVTKQMLVYVDLDKWHLSVTSEYKSKCVIFKCHILV